MEVSQEGQPAAFCSASTNLPDEDDKPSLLLKLPFFHSSTSGFASLFRVTTTDPERKCSLDERDADAETVTGGGAEGAGGGGSATTTDTAAEEGTLLVLFLELDCTT